MLKGKTIGFLGTGRLGEALIDGLIASGLLTPGQILASDISTERLAFMAEKYEVKVYNKCFETMRQSDIIFITVKPKDVEALLTEVAGEVSGDKLVISAAAGVTTEFIESTLAHSGAEGALVVRAMPNTPCLVGEGAIGISGGSHTGGDELEVASTLFSSVGKVIVTEEDKIDAVTGLSGSGPAYVFTFMEALVAGGVEEGLSKEDATVLALQTTLGAANLAIESDLSLRELVNMVTSPGGTTIEGLKALEDGGLDGTVRSAVKAATERSKELASTLAPKGRGGQG